jgi:hypothetical protein
VPDVFCGCQCRRVSAGALFDGARTVTAIGTVPERGGVPLSVTVTKAVRAAERARGVRGRQSGLRLPCHASGRADAKRRRLASIRPWYLTGAWRILRGAMPRAVSAGASFTGRTVI